MNTQLLAISILLLIGTIQCNEFSSYPLNARLCAIKLDELIIQLRSLSSAPKYLKEYSVELGEQTSRTCMGIDHSFMYQATVAYNDQVDLTCLGFITHWLIAYTSTNKEIPTGEILAGLQKNYYNCQ